MDETYHIRIKKDYATAIIKDLEKMEAVELITDDIPAWHISVVNERMEEYRKDPSSAIDLDKALNDIEKEL